MRTPDGGPRLIEADAFPFEFVSRLAERESWRKEVHRPIYHVHKWWAKRLGSVFRGILLGCTLDEGRDLAPEFFRPHGFDGVVVFDPFMGSGTTVGEAHKLGFTALGRDINPVAVNAVRTSLGPLDRRSLSEAMRGLSEGIGAKIRELYRATDSRGRPAEALYHFWVMQAPCPHCDLAVDLFPSWVIARNAYPARKPEVQVLCPSCGDIFPGLHGSETVSCRKCGESFRPDDAPARGARARCRGCGGSFAILEAVARIGSRPPFRAYGKLVLTGSTKEYLAATPEDHAAYAACSEALRGEVERGGLPLPSLALEDGYNTRQAMRYGFRNWRDFFNDRQLLALGWLLRGISEVPDESARDGLLTLFSGVLEFNNLFASYKGEGTGAVRHMFSHHILKPERTPIEANVWGTTKSSGAFSTLFRSRLLRAIEYRSAPVEVGGSDGGRARVCSPPFSGRVETVWPASPRPARRAIHLSCGDSRATGLPEASVDLVVTDPPFFDNVHYSELADFFFAWQQLVPGRGEAQGTTRSPAEVQDSDSRGFSSKLRGVLEECHRVLKDDGLLVFTYHHSREEGWASLADAVLSAGFVVVNSQPVKAEMSVATPKSQAKEPIQLDIIVVCRKRASAGHHPARDVRGAVESARSKVRRLQEAGFTLSKNDRKVVLYGQLLTSLDSPADADNFAEIAGGLSDDGPDGPGSVPAVLQQKTFF